ncbi:hypothetical protein [Clostridium estertheticum]|uniref:Core-binding (CB) domain-containing protein n=1 Tax=Clostridium estertheticum TaxID=238834 RepID=A0A7Y3WV17_9CLOT|nr:hypothetical protein [Clostridium estertheticum]NNU78585.1 hypothetical protein [Clostridium estertheticum]WBL49675.1 hypothetical protein LOR37_23240 [Clostridium estertheticum]
MSRHANIKSQLDTRLDQLKAIGESKVKARAAYQQSCKSRGEKCNTSKSPLIHSLDSITGYRQTYKEFSSWLRENRSEVYLSKDLKLLDKEICYDYLNYRQDNNISAWVISKDQSALNKVLDLDLNKREGCLRERRQEDITRSRLPRKMDTRYNPKNYEKQIDIAKGFGLRRECVCGGNYAIKESSLFIRDSVIYCSIIGKGGKYREAPCLDKYKEIMLERYNIPEHSSLTKSEFVINYRSSVDDPLFDKYTNLIDNHAFRAEYAKDLYSQLVIEKDAKDLPMQTYYKGYYEDCVGDVSRALGHDRLNVVVDSYFK